MRDKGRRGGAALEMALIAPWAFFLFVGAVDWGFYSYALIAVQSAARVAGHYASTSSATAVNSTGACALVLSEMKKLPNIGTSVTSCDALPLTVTVSAVKGPDNGNAAQVSVAYQTVSLIPLPGVLAGQFTITKTVLMRLRS